MPDLRSSTVHAVTGVSHRLRDEVAEALVRTWNGPHRRHVEPDDIQRIVLDLATASLFEEPACHLVRGRGDWVRRQRDAFRDLVGVPVSGGVIVLVTDPPPRKDDALFKALAKANAVHSADEPASRDVADWLTARIAALPQGAKDARKIAFALIDHVGTEIDALLAAVDVLSLLRLDQPLDAAAVGELHASDAAKPLFAFSDAVLEGEAGKALAQLHAVGASHPEQALMVLISDVRKVLACLDSDDDAEAARMAGLFGRPNLYHPRRRAQRLGRIVAQRLLRGAALAQRAMRSGADAMLVLETLVLHARALVRRAGR